MMSELSLDNIDVVVKLAPDNFVPVSRTPWAGKELGASIKAAFVDQPASSSQLGESWDFSVEPAFPSKVVFPESLRGKLLSSFGEVEILVKLISTASPLSFQVHPADSHPALDSKTCGKPESWLVLAAEPGAGVYIGLKKCWSRSDLQKALAEGSFRASDLHFVPVKIGDFFDIAPGVTHALGPGLVIYEPQRVLAGKSGVTWRLWDWDRRYAADGVTEDIGGKARAIHLDLGLGVCSPEHQTGEVLESQARRMGSESSPRPGVKVTSWTPNAFYHVYKLELDSGSTCDLSLSGGFASAIQVKGVIEAGSSKIETRISQTWSCGESMLLCSKATPLKLSSSAGRAEILFTCQANARFSVS